MGALLLSVLILALALQPPTRLRLDLGSAYDKPYLNHFHDSERSPAQGPPQITFRWTQPQSSAVRAAALGPGPWLITMRASSGSGDRDRANLQFQIEDAALSTQVIPEWRVVRLVMPGTDADHFSLKLTADPYRPPADPRRDVGLGVAADWLSITPLGWRPWLPLGIWAYLAGTLLILALAGMLGKLPSWALGAALLSLGAVSAVVLAAWRTALSEFAPALFGVTLGAFLLMLLVGGAATLLARRGHTMFSHPWPIAGLIALGFLIRLAGLRHPQSLSNDLFLHVNNLIHLAQPGEVVFTEGLPCEAGGGRAPYPPGFYIILAPLLLLVTDHVLLIQVATALADALVVGVIWMLMRLGGSSQRQALLASALYLVPPPLLASLNVGELANIGGQFMALAVVSLLLAYGVSRTSREYIQPQSSGAGSRLLKGSSGTGRRRWLPVLVLGTAAGLLGHLGAASQLALLLGCWAVILFFMRQRDASNRLILAGIGGGVLALALYYSAFAFEPQMLQAPQPVPGLRCPPRDALVTKIGNHLRLLIEPWTNMPLTLLLVGLLGVGVAQRRTPRLYPLLLAWWAATLLSFGTLLFSAQTLRWMHFLAPALAAGGGLLVAALWDRGRLWRALALAIVALTLAYGLILYGHHIATYNH